MSIDETTNDSFVQERLNSLYEIDCKIVSLLDNMSTLFQTYSVPKTNENDLSETKKQFTDQTKAIYNNISKIAIGLRKEVKIMDDNIGVYDKNKDGIMILPISVDQKNTTLGEKKLTSEIEELGAVVNGDLGKVKTEDVDMQNADTEEANNDDTIKLERPSKIDENQEVKKEKEEKEEREEELEMDT